MTWLADLILKSTLVLSLAWLGSVLLRRRSASARHVWWCASIAALAALPLFMLALPRLVVAVPAPVDGAALYRFTASAIAAAETPAPAQDAAPIRPGRPAGPASWNWRQVAVALWAAGAGLAFLRLLAAHFAVARLNRRATPLDDPAWSALLAEGARQLGIPRPVRLLAGGAGRVPMTSGWLHPVIHLPAAAAGWNDDRRRVVLLHELAHIRRCDALTGALARLALCGYWFHPLAWVAERRMTQARESASDDLVLSAGASASGYAGHLLDIAASCQTPAMAAAAAVCMVRPSQLEGRLAAILDARLPRAAAGPALAAAAVLAAVIAAAPLAAMQAQSSAKATPTAAETDALIRTALAARDHATLEFLAAELVTQRKYGEANRLSAAALEMRALRFGGKSREYAEGLVAQGNLLRREGKWEEAGEAFERAASLQEAGGAPDARTLGFLALNAQRQKRYEQAAEFYRRALALQPDAAVQAHLLTGLATLEAETGRNDEAEQHFRSALAARDDDSPASATTLELFARFLQDRNRGDEARPMQLRAAQVRKASVAAGNRLVPAGEAPLKAGGNVEAPRLVSKIEPQYSDAARVARYQGMVVLGVIVAPDGRVYQIDLLRSLGLGLDEQAAEAVRQWLFEPGKLNGVPVPVKATIEINFRLM